jgi:competence protein ComEC
MSILVRATLAYIAGLILPFYLVPQVAILMRAPWMPTATAVCACVVLLLIARRRHAARSRRLAIPATFIVLGVLAGGAARNRNDADCRARIPRNAVVTFAGQPASLPGKDGGLALQLIVARVHDNDRGSAAAVGGARTTCSGLVRAKLPAGYDVRSIDGSAISGTGTWLVFDERTRLPVMPDRRGVLVLQRVAPASVAVPTSHALKMRTHTQSVVRATLREYGLAEALVLAQREGVDRSVNDAFTATGMSHLLSISGTHVGLVAAVLMGFAAFLRIGGNAGRLGATAGVVAYVGFLGAPAAAARSAIQIILLLSGRILQRPSDAYTVLAAAALWLLVTQPLNLLDAGFQLSFAGVIGLIAYRGRIAARLPRSMPVWLRDGIAASIAASGVTMPIAAIQFGTIALVGIPARIIAVPLVGLALPAVALVLVAASFSMPIARFLASGTDLLLSATARVAEVAMRVPGGHFPITPDRLLFMLLVCACVVFAWSWQREHPFMRRLPFTLRTRVAMIAAVVVVIVAWTPQLLSLRDTGAIQIHMIDVGQGDAIAVRTPHGHWLLIDTGPRTLKFDAGRSRVVPYLRGHGARRLDALVLTHPDADHIGGAASVLSMMGAAAVIDPGTPAGKPLYLQTMEAAEAGTVRWLKARDGRHLDVDGVRLDFLYPESDSLDGTGDANDLSVAFRLRYGRFSAMFMGDAPIATEDLILERYGSQLSSAVLKVGHHGSYTSTGEAFLNMVRPSLALVSVGRDNRYGHPNPDVMARLVRHHVRVLRTDEHGALLVRAQMTGRFSVATQR